MPAKKKKVVKKAAKPVAKKKAVKKVVKKVAKKAVKKVVKKAPAKKMATAKSALSKSQLLGQIAEMTELKRKEVSDVMECLSVIVDAHMKKGAVGEFTLPGLAKFRVVRKPATKARKGINPFTGEPTVFKAKPARNVVKVRPLKKLKDMAS